MNDRHIPPNDDEGTPPMTASTKRRARRAAHRAPEPAAKKCVLCQNTDENALRDYGDGGDVSGYWMCSDVESCVARARSAAAKSAATKPEAAEEPAEVTQ